MIHFVVLGKPAPAGSKRAFTHPSTGRIVVTDASKGSRSWKQQVAGEARVAMGDTPLMLGPIRLRLLFTFAHNKGHYRTGKFAHLLKDDAPVFHTTPADATKLVRCVEDSLKRIVWRDDAQVANQTAIKVWGERDMCEVWIDDCVESRDGYLI